MTTDESIDDAARPDGAAHQGPGRWARRGAAGIGLPPGEGVPDCDGSPSAAAGDEPDISPSLAGGHAGASHPGRD